MREAIRLWFWESMCMRLLISITGYISIHLSTHFPLWGNLRSSTILGSITVLRIVRWVCNRDQQCTVIPIKAREDRKTFALKKEKQLPQMTFGFWEQCLRPADRGDGPNFYIMWTKRISYSWVMVKLNIWSTQLEEWCSHYSHADNVVPSLH